MSVQAPRHESDLPKWQESVTEQLNRQPVILRDRLDTDDNSGTVITSLPISPNTVYDFEWQVMARQKAGSGGTVGNGAVYVGRIAFHLVGGTATVIGSGASVLAVEDDASWNCTVTGSGNQAQWTVTGATNQVIAWRSEVHVRTVSV